MTNKERVKLLFQFLIQEKANVKFVLNCHNHGNIKAGQICEEYVEDLFKKFDSYSALFFSFNFFETPEKFEYWENIETKWKKFYDDHLNKLYGVRDTNYNTAPELIDLCESTSTEPSCDHSTKYINSANGIKFWYCPKCKQDLGDA